MTSLAEALPVEINRVRALQQEFRTLGHADPRVMTEPQVMIMEISIQHAISALATGNVLDILAAYENLKGFEE